MSLLISDIWFKAAVSLLRERGMSHVIDEVIIDESSNNHNNE